MDMCVGHMIMLGNGTSFLFLGCHMEGLDEEESVCNEYIKEAEFKNTPFS